MAETRRYDFRIPAGGVRVLEAGGTRFLVRSTTGLINIRWDRGNLDGIEAGQGQVDPKGFSRLFLTNPTAAEISGYLQISDDLFIDNRITGDVSVINGEQIRTLNQGRFFGAPTAQYAAPDYTVVQLWNPSLSQRTVILTALEVSQSLAGTFVIFGNAVALTDDLSAGRIANAYVGGASPYAQLRAEASVGAAVAQPYGYSFRYDNIANQLFKPTLSGPIAIGPGKGLCILSYNPGAGVQANMEWYEEIIN